MAYKRKFIILRKESSHVGGNIKGHGKLEMRGIRGVVTVNIENAGREDVYNVLFLSNDKANSTFYLGKIFTDQLGKGRGEYNFLQRELENQRFPLERVSALMVMKDNDVILGGYINKDDKSIETYINSLPKYTNSQPGVDPYEEELEEIYEEEAIEELIEETFEEEITEEITEETFEEETLEEVPKEILEEEVLEEEILEEIPEEIYGQEELEKEIYEETKEESYENLQSEESEQHIQKETSEEDKDITHMKRLSQKNQTTMYILSILRFFPYINPFKYNLSGFNWWVVELDRENEYKSFLPYFSYITGGNSKEAYASGINSNELINKYNHYLFGLYNEGEEVKYYVYGIPGSFTKEEHPNNGERGFNTWYEGKDGVGYWILYIDPMTGKQVHPQVPMIPID